MKTPEQYAASRRNAEAALAKIRAFEPLTQADALTVGRILEQVLAGYDARDDLDITHKPGAAPTERGKHVWMAAHYWKIYPTEGRKKAQHTVATTWGGTDSNAYKIALEYKDDVERLAAEMTLDQILVFARILATL